MIRIFLLSLIGLGLALCLPVASTCRAQVDSKAWGKVRTIGPPGPAVAGVEYDKRVLLDEIARGLRPMPGVPLASPGITGPATAVRRLGPVAPARVKPREMSTSVPLTGEALARSLAQEGAKAAAPVPVPKVSSARRLERPVPGVVKPGVTGTAIPGTPLNEDQRAKLEAARANAAASPAPVRR